VLNEIKNPDYVALFDVDNRPAKDFITKCIAALEQTNLQFFHVGAVL
jgi:cellulose synthase/poly-beta-1,6-N-acetylglucosamine synthase-like glycosyltransferase